MVKEINILGHVVSVELSSHLMESGYCDIKNGQICISSEMSKGQVASTLIHEILEYINVANDLGLDHKAICVLETSLFQIISANPTKELLYAIEG